MLTAWPAIDHAIVLAVGPHDRSAASVYDTLLHALGIDMPADERTKPPCCDESGEPPVSGSTATTLAKAIERLAKQRRRRR